MSATSAITGSEPVDTTVRLVTPERVSFRYAVAGPFRRGVAYLLDWMIYLAILLVLALILFMLVRVPAGLGVFLVGLFVLQWGYGAFCEVVFNGRTPGKWIMGLRVVSENGVPIVPAQALTRNLLQVADGWTMWFLPGLISMTLSSRFQRLGDLAAGTMVVIEQRPMLGKTPRVDEKPVRELVEMLPPRVIAGPELSRLLADYVKRRSRFSPAYRESMARELAEPLAAQYGLPPRKSADAVLCAVYMRVFLGEDPVEMILS